MRVISSRIAAIWLLREKASLEYGKTFKEKNKRFVASKVCPIRIHTMQEVITYLGIFVVLLMTLGLKSIKAGDTIYVKWDATGNNDGSSWEDGFTNLQEALSLADTGDQIWVAKGIYFPADTFLNRDVSFVLKSNVALYGGFAGYESSLDERDWETNITVLSGDIDHNDVTDSNGVVIDPDSIVGNNSFHVIKAENIDSTAILDGFFITAGNADSQSLNGCGGGMLAYYGNLKVVHCTFRGNKASQKGGGLYNTGGEIILSNCVFFMNRSYNYGGGLYTYGGNLTVENCAFIDNLAYYGGGTFNENSMLKFINCTFEGNWTDYGGGIYNSNSSCTQIFCSFCNNITGFGGGVYNDENSSCKLIGCVFNNNYAYYGGAVQNSGCNAQLINCSIIGNISQVQGGGVCNEYCDPIFINCLFYENGAAEGGGISNKNSNPILINCTSYNNDGAYGGGMHNNQSNPILTNCIFWGDYAIHGSEIYNHLSTPFILYCDIEGSGGSYNWDSIFGFNGGGNIDLYPLFVDTASGDLHLQAGSPAIDSGNNDIFFIYFPSPGDSIDLAGNPRIIDGNQDGIAVIDMGAFEYQVSTHKKERSNWVSQYGFFQIYPNPTHSTTTMYLNLPQKSHVSLKVYDVSGREVCKLIDTALDAGLHKIQFIEKNLPSGVYYFHIEAAKRRKTIKVVLLR